MCARPGLQNFRQLTTPTRLAVPQTLAAVIDVQSGAMLCMWWVVGDTTGFMDRRYAAANTNDCSGVALAAPINGGAGKIMGSRTIPPPVPPLRVCPDLDRCAPRSKEGPRRPSPWRFRHMDGRGERLVARRWLEPSTRDFAAVSLADLFKYLAWKWAERSGNITETGIFWGNLIGSIAAPGMAGFLVWKI